MPPAGRQEPEAPRTTALIADLAGSRDLGRDRRREVQDRLTDLLEELNDGLHDSLHSRFAVTLGDEFQGLLRRPASITDILWRLRRAFPSLRFWTGVGHGGLDTPLLERAIGMDGPAFHNARRAVERARDDAVHGGVFVGFDADDQVLTGLGSLLDHHRQSFTTAQLEAVDRVREGHKESEVAAALDVSPQAISKRLKSAGWEPYRSGEQALRALLRRYDTVGRWGE